MRHSVAVTTFLLGALACLTTRRLAAQDPETRGQKVPLVLTVEPKSPVPGTTPASLDTLVTFVGVPLTIRGAGSRELAGVTMRITVTPAAKAPKTFSAKVQDVTFQIDYTPTDTGVHRVDAEDPSARFRASTRFVVRGALVGDHDVPQEEVEETVAALTEAACKTNEALVKRVDDLPSSPAVTELKRRLEELDRDGKDAVPCGDVPDWVSGTAHLNELRRVAPEMHTATRKVVLELDQWLGAAKQAKEQAPRALAELTQGNVMCDQLDIIIAGLKFLDFYMGLIVKPGSFLQDWAKENVPTKLVAMIPAVRRTPAVKEGIETGWKGVVTYKPARENGKLKIGAQGAERALGHVKMLNAVLVYAASRVFDLFCQRFQGPVSGSMSAEFYRGPRVWWDYTVTIAGQLVLRYPKNATGKVIALTGEFIGNATRFESHDAAISVLYPGLAEGVVFSQIRLEPFALGDFPRLLGPNLGVTPSVAGADFNPITSIIDQGGPIAQYVMTPAFFRIPVRGEVGETTLRLELGNAAVDFDDRRTKVIKIILPVLSLMPDVVSYALPYKGARFILSRAMNDGIVTMPLTRSGEAMTVEQQFDRERRSGETKGVYKLTVKACNPGC